MDKEIEQIRKKIGIKIKLERTKHSLSQEKLSELADLSKTYVNSIEHAQSSPTLDTLIKIARAFNMSLSDLVDIEKFTI